MYIEIETEDLIPNQITSNKNEKVYHIVEQPALMFTDSSRYPEHFNIRHCFTENKNEADKTNPLPKGRYQLNDSAFSIDRYKTVQINLNAKTLKLMGVAAIPQTKAVG